jgi:ABC-2 type transport system permease protein
MKALLSVMRREIQAYFVSPIAYTVIVGLLVISGFGFIQALRRYLAIPPNVFEMREITLHGALIGRLVIWMYIAVLLSLPALSMRLFSEERKGGTFELLMTSPMTTLQLVFGKYLGALTVYVLALVLTLPYMGILESAGNPEWLAIGAFYLGLILFGGVLLAIGLFASSLTENQIVAVVLTYAFFIPFFLLDRMIVLVGTKAGDMVSGLSVVVGLQTTARGLVDTHHLVLPISLILAFLLLSASVLDSSRWR